MRTATGELSFNYYVRRFVCEIAYICDLGIKYFEIHSAQNLVNVGYDRGFCHDYVDIHIERARGNKLFDLVERHADTTKMGLTSTKVSQLAAYGARFPQAPLHYDGAVSEETLDALKEISEGHTVTVWMHMGTPLVAWSKLPPATPEIVAAVKARGFRMGIWILENDEEMQAALALGADVVETTGGIKP